jgi:hypothetical protein
VKEYSPKRRTAIVLSGSGVSGAYHAGVLKALDESGVKIDLLVGSGVGAVAAAFGAVAGGSRLYNRSGFWDGARWSAFYRLRPAANVALVLLAASFGVFLLPLALALIAGLLFPLVLIGDLLVPGGPARVIGRVWSVPEALAGPYLATLAVPIFALSILAAAFVLRAWLKDRRRFAEAFESVWDAQPGAYRLRRSLWEIARGPALSQAPPSELELGQRYVALLTENLGQPGFRELVLRTADLETGEVLSFVILDDAHRTAFARARALGPRSRLEGLPGAVDLREPGYDALLFDAVLTGLLPPVAGPLRRASFPKGGLHSGETHRLTDATLLGGCGITEAVAAGAEQIVVVAAAPEVAAPSPRRRGPRARLNGLLAAREREVVESDVRAAERINRMVETLGHRVDGGGRAWEDPASGRVFRDLALYVIRPGQRPLLPLDLDGARDAATEVVATAADLLELGHRDAYRLFVEPVVGAAPALPRVLAEESGRGTPLEL